MMTDYEIEVVWPKSKHDYLVVPVIAPRKEMPTVSLDDRPIEVPAPTRTPLSPPARLRNGKFAPSAHPKRIRKPTRTRPVVAQPSNGATGIGATTVELLAALRQHHLKTVAACEDLLAALTSQGRTTTTLREQVTDTLHLPARVTGRDGNRKGT